MKREKNITESKNEQNENVLAFVNNQKITKEKLDTIYNLLPERYKEYFRNDKAGLLEEVINREFLIQEARRLKINGENEDFMISSLLKKITEQVETEQKNIRIQQFIDSLRGSAKVVLNEKWIKEQESATADNPLSKALKSKRPVLADFGRGTCIPCKMMQPILEKLKKQYEGKAEILIIDVGEYPALTRKYRITIIPTQIFFDPDGNEVYRHQGFMPEADIIEQLEKLGVK